MAPFFIKWRNLPKRTTFLESSCKTEQARKFPCNSEKVKSFHSPVQKTRWPLSWWNGRMFQNQHHFWNPRAKLSKRISSHAILRRWEAFILHTSVYKTRWLLFWVNGCILKTWQHLWNTHAKLSVRLSFHPVQRRWNAFILETSVKKTRWLLFWWNGWIFQT